MSTSELIDKIRTDGRARVADVEAGRDARLAEIAARREDEVASLETEYGERIEREERQIRERSQSRARLERRKALLAARWDVIDRVFGLAAQKAVEGKEYESLLKGLVKRHATGNAAVRASQRDSRRLGVKPEGTVNISGGVVIQTGKQYLDFSLEESLAAIRSELAPELAGSLFPDQTRE